MKAALPWWCSDQKLKYQNFKAVLPCFAVLQHLDECIRFVTESDLPKWFPIVLFWWCINLKLFIFIHGKYFETSEAAEKFYYDNAHVVGFSVRKDIKWRGKDIDVQIRQWYCSCEGFKNVDKAISSKRVRTPQKETRTGYEVVFLVNYCSKKKQYVVKKFDTKHNHPLVLHALTQFVRSAINCRDSDVAQVTALRSINPNISCIWVLGW